MENKKYERIIDLLKTKSCAKQKAYNNAIEQFAVFKQHLSEYSEKIIKDIGGANEKIDVYFKDINEFEAELKFAGDVLIFSLQTNIFHFEPKHEVNQLDYVKNDPSLGYCALIQVYNFLGDTVKYNRSQDVGYLIGRIFLNRQNHFFVEGKRELGFLYNDFDKAEFNSVYMKAIIEATIEYAIDFELYSPPYQDVQLVTYEEKQFHSINAGMKTGKRLGFQFNSEDSIS
ncbi:MAG: hypothetical protein ACJAZ3_001298 [Sphingobacteriales bacterium]|jgi:hypothetical protein